ncbi:MAG: hypothetical protein K6T61_09300, partial [Bryobacteraceae bacterium]|nr:hypothetical protein [Bryobacteraceae bacterium]
MKIEEIRELIKVVTETGVAELEVQRGDDRVRIVRSAPAQPPAYQHVVIPAVTAPASLETTAPSSPSASAASAP